MPRVEATPLCRGKPPDWWEVGDDGNRIAAALCRRCPRRGVLCLQGDDTAPGDPRPTGVVRSAVPYVDSGRRARLHGCGYPLVRVDRATGEILRARWCGWCDPVVTPQWQRIWPHGTTSRRPAGTSGPGRARPRSGVAAERVAAVRRFAAEGLRDVDIAALVGVTVQSVARIRRRVGVPGLYARRKLVRAGGDA